MSEQFTDPLNEDKVKIQTVISHLQVEEHLDKEQLSDAFHSAGLDEVNDTVSETNESVEIITPTIVVDRPDILTYG